MADSKLRFRHNDSFLQRCRMCSGNDILALKKSLITAEVREKITPTFVEENVSIGNHTAILLQLIYIEFIIETLDIFEVHFNSLHVLVERNKHDSTCGGKICLLLFLSITLRFFLF